MKSQARLRLRKPPPRHDLGELFMPQVNGKPFRCLCGANVFRRVVWRQDFTTGQQQLFICNACGRNYTGS